VADADVLDLAKRRGFLWPAFDAYGGAAGFYDYGPLGAAMKTAFENLWRHIFLHTEPLPMGEVFCPRVTPYEVLKASGHVDEFTDLVVKCQNGHPMRADHLVKEAGYDGNADALSQAGIDVQVVALKPACPTCGAKKWTPAAPMNLMNQTEIGPGSGRVGYLRPETAQGIFTDFPLLLRYFRGKLPFGAIQLGGSNRNEISPRQGMLRLREFSMMEAEVFFADTNAPLAAFAGVAKRTAVFVPNTTEKAVEMSFGEAVSSGMVCNQALGYFLARTQQFLLLAGMDPKRLRFRQHLENEMAHYAQDCWDAEFYSDRYGWIECVGIADRGCYDLSQHAKHSGRVGDFTYRLALADGPRFEARRVEVDAGKLGRTFKAQAKAVAAAIQQEFIDAAAKVGGYDSVAGLGSVTFEGQATAPATLHVTIDGASVQVPADCIKSIEEGTFRLDARNILPSVIEPSFGVDRILYALWEHAYEAGEKNGEPYIRLRLSPYVAPVQVAVLALTSKDGMPEKAAEIEWQLRAAGLRTDSDLSGNIGRRYARQDEAGTPYCVTVDQDTMQDGSVTVRDRDTTQQERVASDALVQYLRRRCQPDHA
jgi:glycyl-tRNA synthetase